MIARHERLPTDISPDFSSVQVYCRLFMIINLHAQGEHLQGKALGILLSTKLMT